MKNLREQLKEKKRIVIKIGSSSLTHSETGDMDYIRMEKLVRELSDIRNQGKEVILVSSGAIAAGKKVINLNHLRVNSDEALAVKQACSAVGQARLMMTYQRLFAEYNQIAAQILMTKNTIVDNLNRFNAHNTFSELLKMGAIPIVNENDAISVDELAYGNFGDNDTLAANVAELVEADLLILLSDIEGMFTADPKSNPDASLIHTVTEIDEELEEMAGGSTSDFGTGGMTTKVHAAKVATEAGADMVIANGDDIYIINEIMEGKMVGTLFLSSGKDGEGYDK